MKGEAKQARLRRVAPHRLARTEIGGTDPPAARKTTKKHLKAAKSQGKPPKGKRASTFENRATLAKRRISAKATAHAGKTKSKTPESTPGDELLIMSCASRRR
jgi:hypothetical protein